MEDKEKDLEKQEEQEKELEEEIEKFKKLEEETEEMIDEEAEQAAEEIEEDEEKTDDDDSDEESTEEDEESNTTQESSPEEKTEDSKKYQKIFIGVLVAIILLLLFLIVTKKYNNKHSKNDDYVTVSDMKKESKEIMNIDSSKDTKKQDEIKKEQKEKNKSKNAKQYDKLNDKQKEKTEVVPKKNDTPIEKLDNVDYYDDFDENGLPKKYNLKDKMKLKVEDQQAYGLCWAFASNNSIETNYKLQNNKDLDLSEIYDDYMYSDYLFGFRRPHAGGSFYFITDLSDMFGLSKESDDEYRDYTLEESFDFLGRERNLYIDKSIDFPSIYKLKGKPDGASNKDVDYVRNKVKTHIMEYGSVYAVVYGEEKKNCYTSGTDEDEWSNHAISIVGWDDTYPRDKFKASDGSKPLHDGAYIILNSWGDGVGDKGYQYYSYDDAYIESEMMGVVSVTDTKENFYKLDDYSNTIQKVIRKSLGYRITEYNGEEVINPNAFLNMYALDLSNMNLTNVDLREIVDLFPDIQSINLANNNITNVSILAELYGLEYLDLSNNKVTDVSVLKGLNNLYALLLDGNANVTGYSNLKGLEYVSLNNCNITNLEDLSDLNLYDLSLSNNNISSINIKDGMYAVELNNNAFSNIDFLKGKSFDYIDLSNNNISDVSIFKDVEVTELILDNNDITNLDLSNESIYYVSAEGNKINKITKNDNITYVNLSKNNLENYDLIKNYSKVELLMLNDNNISSLKGIKDFKELQYLYLDGNKINKIDDYSTKVTELSLDKNGIESIEGVSGFKNLDTIYLNSNGISDFSELAKIKSLVNIDIGNNKVSNLDDINKVLSDLDSIYLSLENTQGVTGKVGDNVEGINLTNASIENINLDGDHLYAINMAKTKGDFDFNEYLKNHDNYYVVGEGQEITEKEFNKYLETYYINNDNLPDWYSLFFGSISYDEEDDEFDEDNYLIKYANLVGFDVDYKVPENDGVYGLTDKYFRRYMTNNYFYMDSPNVKFNEKFDGFNLNRVNDNYDILLENNRIKFASE